MIPNSPRWRSEPMPCRMAAPSLRSVPPRSRTSSGLRTSNRWLPWESWAWFWWAWSTGSSSHSHSNQRIRILTHHHRPQRHQHQRLPQHQQAMEDPQMEGVGNKGWLEGIKSKGQRWISRLSGNSKFMNQLSFLGALFLVQAQAQNCWENKGNLLFNYNLPSYSMTRQERCMLYQPPWTLKNPGLFLLYYIL